jgi:hypothetical protein
LTIERKLNDFIVNSVYYLTTSIFTLISWNSFQISPAIGSPLNWSLVAEREIKSEPQIESAISIFEGDSVYTKIGLLLMLVTSFPAILYLTSKYHERRLLLCSMIIYSLAFISILVLSFFRYPSPTLSIFFLELIMSISRILIFSGASTFLMKFLMHQIPSQSLFFNSAFTLSLSEALSNLTTSGLTKNYSEFLIGSTLTEYFFSTYILYLGILIGLTVLTVLWYGELRIRYQIKIPDNCYYKLLM